MKKTILKYFFEFIVIVIGVSISFYAENYNDSLNKIQVKNQSLNRILENLKLDNTDNRFNYKAHSESLISSEWILTNRNNLSAYSRDTIGFHLSKAINILTYFVDNQEEYKTIQSSGYIEYIENESLVKGLQEKYVRHKVMKFIEGEIRSKAKVLADFEFKNSKINNDSMYMGFYLIYKRYIGDLEIPNEFYDRIIEKASFQKIYLSQIKGRIQRDSILANEINKEIFVD